MATVFISYARDDAGRHEEIVQFVTQLRDLLGAGSVFFDVSTIRPGQTWSPDIDRALDTAQLLILFTSSKLRAVTLPKLGDVSSVVRREIDVARKRGITIMPVASGKQKPPRQNELPQDLHFLAGLHWEDLDVVSLDVCVRRAMQALAEAIIREVPPSDRVARAILRFQHEPVATLQAIVRSGEESDNPRNKELASLAWLRLTKPDSLSTSLGCQPEDFLVQALLAIRTFKLRAAGSTEAEFCQRVDSLENWQVKLRNAPLSQHLALTLATAYRLEYERAVGAVATRSQRMIKVLGQQQAAMSKKDGQHCRSLRELVVARVPWFSTNDAARRCINELSSPSPAQAQRKGGASRTSAPRKNAGQPGASSKRPRGAAGKPASDRRSGGTQSPPSSRPKKGRPNGRTG